MERLCCSPKCTAPSTGACSGCHTASYCSKEHQRASWKAHKMLCPLIGQSVPSLGWLGSSTFLGTAAELATHRLYGGKALEATCVTPRPGWRQLSLRASLEAHSPPEAPEHYFSLCSTEDFAQVLAAFPDPTILIPRPCVLLCLEYCLWAPPRFLLHAPPGAAGFTAADLIAAASRSYQWCYQMEAAAVGPPPRMRGMLNRGQTSGPFCIAMHDLEDLVLHTLSISGQCPEEGTLPENNTVSVRVSLGIDS
jgi:hypothetical protein